MDALANATPEWRKCFELLLDPTVSEIETNGRDSFFMKQKGKRIKLDISLPNDDVYYENIGKSLVPLVRHFSDWDTAEYVFEGPLEFYVHGDRVKGRTHIVLPPATDSAQITIAKKSTSLINLESIAERGSMSLEMKQFLEASVKARMCLILSGSTGAGKALHKDTLIPTINGMRKVSDIKIGDTLFDETGEKTSVLKKYSPKDPRSFELVFKNGTKVKTSAGHLWKVTLLNEIVIHGPRLIPLFNSEQKEIFEKEATVLKNDDEITINEMKALFKIEGNSLILNTARKVKPIRYDKSRAIYSKIDVWEELTKEKEFRDIRIQLFDSKPSYLRPEKIMTTLELFEYGVINPKGRFNFAIESLSNSVDYDEKALPIPPYVLGAWLGDGMSDRGNICGTDLEIRDKVMEYYTLEWEKLTTKPYHTKDLYDWKFPQLRQDLRKEGLLLNKHIPSIYKYSSTEQRKELIAGLIDTDGSCSPEGYVELDLTNEQIVRDAFEIVKSLGWKTTNIREKIPFYRDSDGKRKAGKKVFSFSFLSDSLDLQVPRKRERVELRQKSSLTQQSRHSRHYITEINEISDNPEDFFCFMVDSPSHLFLCTEDFIPTHNTTMLESLAKLIPMDTRIGVAEDTPELELIQENVSYLHSVPWSPGMDPNKVATLDWCVAQFNRMRTDMLIIGETRGKEFASFLTAANSGMEGCMTTLHANSASRCLDKMTNFALKGSDRQPIRAVNTDIANTVDLIVQLVILPDGRHRVDSITEVTNTVGNSDAATITTQTLYKYDYAKDNFIKVMNPSDKLRSLFSMRGVNISSLIETQAGTVAPPHSGNALHTRQPKQQSNPFSGGLPIPSNDRTI